MTVLIDDHLLRDWMARRDSFLVAEIAGETVATTNLWYARLCKSAAASGPGALLGGWGPDERRALISGLVALDDNVIVVPMRPLAYLERRLSEAVAEHAHAVDQGTKAQARIGLSFEGGERLRELRGRLDAINAALTPVEPAPAVIDLDNQDEATAPLVPGAGGAVPVHRAGGPDAASPAVGRPYPAPARVADRGSGPER